MIGFLIILVLCSVLDHVSSQCPYNSLPANRHCSRICTPFQLGYPLTSSTLTDSCITFNTVDGVMTNGLLVVALKLKPSARCNNIKLIEASFMALDRDGYPTGFIQTSFGNRAKAYFDNYCTLTTNMDYVHVPENPSNIPTFKAEVCDVSFPSIGAALRKRAMGTGSSVEFPGYSVYSQKPENALDFQGLGMTFIHADQLNKTEIKLIAETLFLDSDGNFFIDSTFTTNRDILDYDRKPARSPPSFPPICFEGTSLSAVFTQKTDSRVYELDGGYRRDLANKNPMVITTTRKPYVAPTTTTTTTTTPPPPPTTPGPPTTSTTTTPTTPTTPTTTPKPFTDVFKLCEMTKQCLVAKESGTKMPKFMAGRLQESDNCTKNRDCRVMVSIGDLDSSQNYIEIEIVGKTTSWVAVALSSDDKMGDDFVVECVLEKGSNITMYTSWNVRREESPNRTTPTNERMSTSYASQKFFIPDKGETRYEGGNLFCAFSLKRRLFFDNTQKRRDGKRYTFNLMSTPYFVQMAFGPPDPKGLGTLTPHEVDAWVSGYKVGIGTRFSPTSSQESLIHAHGQIMYFVFIFIFPNAVFISRYYKETFVRRSFFKMRIWKLVHVIAQCVGLFFIFIGHFLLPSANDGWSNPIEPGQTTRHFWTSVIAAALYLFNTFMGLLNYRERRAGSKCNLCHFIHGLLGHVTYLFAMLTLMNAGEVQFSDLPCSSSQVVIAWICIYFCFHIVMSSYYCWSDWIKSEDIISYPPQAFGVPELLVQPETDDYVAPGKHHRIIILILFVASTIIFTLTLMIIGGTAKKENACSKYERIIEFYKKTE